MLPKFEDEGKFNLKNLGCDTTTNLHEYLISNNAVYHKSCYSRYDQRMLNRITGNKKKHVVDAKTDELISLKRPYRKSILETSQMGELICIFCEISNDSQNLRVAGTLHSTSKNIHLRHVFSFTQKLKGMTLVLGKNKVLSKLSSGDLAPNELFYHRSCYKTFLPRYHQKISKKLNSNKEMMGNNENLIKTMRLSQIVNHVYDQKQYETISFFEVSILERSYLNLLKNDHII